jgi:signal transduction histidine kinase
MRCVRTRRLVHRWLRIAGTITWSVIGVTFALFFVDVPPQIGGARWLLWSVAFLGFLVLFWVDTGEQADRRARGRRLVLLLLQSLCALAIAGLPRKPVGFIFLTLVAAQTAGLLSPWAAAGWIVVQSAAMGWIYSQIVPAWEAQAYVAVYLGFQAFAHVVVRAALSEAEARDDLARTHLELSAKEALLAESQRLAERARIGQDLHDVLGHHLAAMSLNLEVASHLTGGEAKSHVEQARALTQKLLDDVREVVTELRSENGYDLEEVVRKIAADMPAPAIHVEVAPEVRVVADAAQAEALIRCVQELITNAARHSGAANLWIALRRRDAGVELSVRDDGRGVERIERGVGLSGLEERFARLGGRFAFASAHGRGFTVTAWLP